MTMVMNSPIPAGDFKARCLQLMERVRTTRTEVVITKRGRPIAKLVPIEDEPLLVFDCMKGTAAIVGDLVAPVVSERDWNAVDPA
jgi:prevent-host-death family protein